MNITKEQLQILIRLQEGLQDYKRMIKARQELFNEENKLIIDTIKRFSDNIKTRKNDISKLAIKEFEDTKEKKLLGGIGIRVGTNMIYDKDKALEWAKSHKLCLQLDKKSFEALVKTQNIDFVTSEENITVTFPKEITLK